MKTNHVAMILGAVALGTVSTIDAIAQTPAWTPSGSTLVTNGATTDVRVNNNVYWGGSNANLRNDQGGSLELGGDDNTDGGGTAYIDFHYPKGFPQDYNVRLMNSADGQLSIGATNIYTWARLGFNTTNPLALLHVNGGGVLATGTGGGTPTSGAGTRLMYIPAKAAFRAGSVSGTQWDDASVGTASFAGGSNNTASGTGSVSFGDANVSSGDYSATFGDHVTAQAYKSLAIGRYNVVGGTTGSWVAGEQLFVAGNGTGTGASSSNAMVLYKNGNMTIAGAYSTSSDARLKRDIVPLTGAVTKLNDIQPAYFYYNDQETHPAGRQVGFIAQEVQKQFPELVMTTESGYLAVSYGNMVAVAVQAIKEQQGTINELRGANAELSARLARLEQMMIQHLPGCCPEPASVK